MVLIKLAVEKGACIAQKDLWEMSRLLHIQYGIEVTNFELWDANNGQKVNLLHAHGLRISSPMHYAFKHYMDTL